jgi:hypothetical protein
LLFHSIPLRPCACDKNSPSSCSFRRLFSLCAPKLRHVCFEAHFGPERFENTPAEITYGDLRALLEAAGKTIGGNDMLIAAHVVSLEERLSGQSFAILSKFTRPEEPGKIPLSQTPV